MLHDEDTCRGCIDITRTKLKYIYLVEDIGNSYYLCSILFVVTEMKQDTIVKNVLH